MSRPPDSGRDSPAEQTLLPKMKVGFQLMKELQAFDFLFDSVEGLPSYDRAHLVLKNYLVGREDDTGKIIVSEKEGDLSPIYLSAVGYRQMQNINGRTI
jgi:hypothetical protein